ncbi:MAG TPA: hypothetical protein VFE47_05015 [Tepidisphaeraceae bacterium]|jgi:hypothetical protein|nr:hypothetical protein [Tepidisphaeraceae bacterium]
MSDIDLAISHSKALEGLLEQKLGATGKGLHEKVSSVETRLPRELVRKIRLVATVRNKIVHESDYKSIDDRNAFLKAAKESERELKAFGPRSGGILPWVIIIGIVVILIAAYVVFRIVMRR